jgi:PST family polysaccharide transporter
MATYGRLAKVGVLWGLLSRGFGELVAIPASMLLARLLTPEEFGIAAAAGFFVQLAQRMTNLGLNMALVQRKDLTPAHTTSVFVFNVVLGLTTWATLALTAPWLGRAFRSQDVSTVLPVAGLTFAISSMASVSHALMVRNLRFRAITAIDAVYAATTACLAVGMAWGGYGFWSLIWSQVWAAAIQTALRFIGAGWWPAARSLSWQSLRELLSFGVGLHFKRLLDTAALNVDNLVVGRMLGLAPLGFYDKSFTMMNRAVNLLTTAGYSVSFRIFAIIQGDQARFRLAYRKVLLASTFASYPVLALLASFAPELFYLMFGPQWDRAVVPFQILCAVGALKTLNVYVSSAVQSAGKVWGEVQRQLGYLVLIVVCAAIGSAWGLVGASAGVLAATLVMAALMQHLVHRVTALSWRDLFEPQVPSVLCASGSALALAGVRAATAPPGPMTVSTAMASMAIAGLTFAAFSLAFLRWSGFRELNSVFEEVVTDLVPGAAPWLGVKIPARGSGPTSPSTR